MRSVGQVARFGRKTCRDHFKPGGRWENKIKIGHKESGWEGVDWINLTRDLQRAVVNRVMNLLVL
jgi:hypothetical protein